MYQVFYTITVPIELIDAFFFSKQNPNLNRPGSGARTIQQRAKSAVTRTRKDSANGVELTINDILHPDHAHLRQETNNVRTFHKVL